MENSNLIIKNLLQQGENDKIEIKANATTDMIAQTVTAYINGRGGDILLGVNEEKKIVGIQDAQQYRYDIRDYLSKNVIPEPPFSINLWIFNYKPLIIISVWEGHHKPYTYKSNIYVRDGIENKIVDINSQISDETNEGTNLTDLNITDTVKEELQKLYEFIKENPFTKVPEIQKYINKSSATVERYLKILKDHQLINFEGSRNHKIGGYKIVGTMSS